MEEALKDYLRCWQAVDDIEKDELAASTIDFRWKQLNALFNLVSSLGIIPQRDEEQEMMEIHCWAKIKENR